MRLIDADADVLMQKIVETYYTDLSEIAENQSSGQLYYINIMMIAITADAVRKQECR